MKIVRFVFNSFGVNTYLVYDTVTLECAVVDPGMSCEREEKKFISFIEQNALRPTHLINTHLHIDHALGNNFVSNYYRLDVEANTADAFLAERIREQAVMFGMSTNIGNSAINIALSGGMKIHIGDGILHVLEVPGHSPGSIALYDAGDGFVITGDALFEKSIGRTDLPGGDLRTLIFSINKELLTLPPHTIVYPGHGNPTSIESELRYNPYLSSEIKA